MDVSYKSGAGTVGRRKVGVVSEESKNTKVTVRIFGCYETPTSTQETLEMIYAKEGTEYRKIYS